MSERNRNRKNTDGLDTFLWLVESDMDAARHKRIVRFGQGRNSSFRPDNKVEVDMQEVRRGRKRNTGGNDTK